MSATFELHWTSAIVSSDRMKIKGFATKNKFLKIKSSESESILQKFIRALLTYTILCDISFNHKIYMQRDKEKD